MADAFRGVSGAASALVIALPLGGVLLAAAARRREERPRPGPPVYHFWTNLAFGVVSGAAATYVTSSPEASMRGFLHVQGWGVLRWLGIGGWRNVAVSFVALDLANCLNHRLFHHVPLFWRFHKVHHSEIHFDYSTFFRTHAGEIVLDWLPGMFWIALLGPTMAATLVYEVFDRLWSQAQHANLKLPAEWETALSRLIMTPEKHFIHHSSNAAQTNSNYATFFAWDRLMNTFRADDPGSVAPGLEGYRDPEALGFWSLMAMPFR
ncbi:MAG TPA: sterol desaturase family protein [Elusimicrobiota bacterium]|nr:sterol desaturase family protein [Elusimicrobiota bacterium]